MSTILFSFSFFVFWSFIRGAIGKSESVEVNSMG